MVEEEATRRRDVGDVSAAAAAGEASSASGLVVSSAVSLVSAPIAMLYEGGALFCLSWNTPPGVSRSDYSPLGRGY